MARMANSAAELGIPMPDRDEVAAGVGAALIANRAAKFRRGT